MESSTLQTVILLLCSAVAFATGNLIKEDKTEEVLKLHGELGIVKQQLAEQAEEMNLILAATHGLRIKRLATKVQILNQKINPETAYEYATYFNHCLDRWNLDEDVLVTVPAMESGYDPKAKSNKGAIGLMQVMPKYWSQELNVTEESLQDPAINIWSGCRIMGMMLEKHGDEYLDRYGGFEPGSGIYLTKLNKFMRRIAWMK